MDDIERQNQRQAKLYEQLLASPVTELTGIINPNGITVGKSRGQELWLVD